MRHLLVAVAFTTLLGCFDAAPDLAPEPFARVRLRVDAGGQDGGERDAGERDAGERDAGEVDAGDVDAGEVDAGEVDAGEGDAGERDAGERDAGERDAGERDAGERDAGERDAGERDAGEVDAGEVDAGEVDAGEVDAGEIDAGERDAGERDAGEVDAGTDAGPQGCWPTAAQHRRVISGPAANWVGPDYLNRTTIWFDRNGNSFSELHHVDGGPFQMTDTWCPDVTYGSGGLVLVPAPWGFDAFVLQRTNFSPQIMAVGTESAAPFYSCTRFNALSFPSAVGVPASTDQLNWWLPVLGRGGPSGAPTRGGVIFWKPADRDGGFVDMGQRVWSVLPRSATETWALVTIDGGLSVRAATTSGPGATHHDVALPPDFFCTFTSTIDHLWCLGPDGQFSEVSDAGIVALVPPGGDNTWRVGVVRPHAPVVLLERRSDAGVDYILVTENSPPRVMLSTSSPIVPALGARPDGGIFFGFWEPPYYPRTANFSLVWGDYCPP